GEEDGQHERVVVLGTDLDVELVLIEVGQELDSLWQHDPVAERHTRKQERRRGEHEAEDHPFGVLLDCGGEEAPELPQHHGQREREAGHEADLHRGEKRLRNTESDWISAPCRKRRVQPVQQMPVEDERHHEAEGQGAERDEDARTELVEMLNERRLLTMATAPRQSLHRSGGIAKKLIAHRSATQTDARETRASWLIGSASGASAWRRRRGSLFIAV